VNELLAAEIEVVQMQAKIRGNAKTKCLKLSANISLREQMKAIKRADSAGKIPNLKRWKNCAKNHQHYGMPAHVESNPKTNVPIRAQHPDASGSHHGSHLSGLDGSRSAMEQKDRERY
jgi:ATP-dependent Lon protease